MVDDIQKRGRIVYKKWMGSMSCGKHGQIVHPYIKFTGNIYKRIYIHIIYIYTHNCICVYIHIFIYVLYIYVYTCNYIPIFTYLVFFTSAYMWNP